MRKKINFEKDFIDRKLERQKRNAKKNDQKSQKRFASLRRSLYNGDIDESLDDDII